jgi:hypothetical protein
MFEFLINTPRDYDLDTGIIDPNTRSTVFDNPKRPGATRQSYVYIAHQCTSEFNKGKFTQTIKGNLLTYLPDQTFKEQQALGRPTGAPATETRTTTSPRLPDNEWTNDNGLSVLTADLPTADTDESVPISLNSPQPQPAPEPPTSDADIVPTTSVPSPSTADIANSPNDGVKEKLALAASYEERAAAARAAGELSNAATLARLAQNSRENAAADAKFGAPPVISNPQEMNRET